MLKLFPLTSKKTAFNFSISYFIVRALYIITPIFSAKLINAAVNRDLDLFYRLVIINVTIFLVTQFFDFISDLCEEECYIDSFQNLINLISTKIKRIDYKKNELTLSEINQIIGQDFEKSNKYFFVEKIRFVYYFLSIFAIIIIMFVKSKEISIVIGIVLLCCVLINIKFGKNISKKSEFSLNQMEKIKDILNDQYKTNKEDRFYPNKQITNELYLAENKTFKKLSREKNIAKSFYLNIVSYGTLNGVILLSMILCDFYLLKGQLDIGTLYLFQSYTSQLWFPGEFIFEFKAKYKENKPIIDKINRLSELEEIDETYGTIDCIDLVNYSGTDSYGNKLHEAINYSFQKNKIYLIRGENGSGKTTLIENILGLAKRYNGEIKYNNSNKYINNFTYVPSKPYISKYFDKGVHNGSDGQKKIFQLSRLSNSEHDVIIYDEPSNYLDENNKKIMFDIIDKTKNNKIVIIISHDLDLFNRGYEELILR